MWYQEFELSVLVFAGPMVWYQVFEYAVGHWFQKSTEHVLGCVLCSPGCFSLFRGSAVLDDNVMKRYTTRPSEAIEFLQYDQGELDVTSSSSTLKVSSMSLPVAVRSR